MNDIGKEVLQDHISPISAEDLETTLKDSFDRKETSIGQHSILDTEWKSFLGEFQQTAGVDMLLKEIYQRDNIDILDEGCGSSLTVFQAVEDVETHSRKGIAVKGYGVTASSSFLNRGVESPATKEKFLEKISDGEELKRTKLLLDGVQYNEGHGYHRFSPDGNLIRITKEDLHLLSRAFPGQKFDLIYSSAAYPHLSIPWLVFKQSCDALKKGGMLLVDAIQSDEIYDPNGNKVSVNDYQRYLQEVNKNYKFHFIPIENNPFYMKVVVEKLGDDNLHSGLYLAERSSQSEISKAITVFSEQTLTDYLSVEELK